MSSEPDVLKARTRTARLVAVTVLLVALTLFLSSAMTFSVWRHDRASDEADGRQIAQLRAELTEAREATGELLRCESAFTTLLQNTSYDHETAIGRLLVGIIQYLQIPIDQRTDGPVRAMTQAVTEANRAYEDAVVLRAEWQSAGSPLPCPLPDD